MSNPLQDDTSTLIWRIILGVKPSPAQAGSRGDFIKDTFFKKSKSGREVLKCDLHPKTF